MELICREAAAGGGSLPFDRFMDLALYAPGLGYYSAGSRKFGEEGDFVTAPELTPLFSHCLASQCAQLLDRLGGGSILEFGAGSGVMAAEILLALERLGTLPERYLIMELSAELQARQRETIARLAPSQIERVEWLARLPEAGFIGVVLANEVLDAMPVQRFRLTGEGVEELHVRCGDEGPLWGATPANGRLEARVRRLREECGLAEGYESEAGFAAEEWVATLGTFMEAGCALLVDYGFPRREYYHPQRRSGTLMCHYRHRSHPDPLILVGLQDITAHVDFTAMAEAAVAAGLQVAGYTSQANFLLATGLLGRIEAVDARRRLEQSAAVKRLIMPGEMGELFKVLALARGVEGPLLGFQLRDERARL